MLLISINFIPYTNKVPFPRRLTNIAAIPLGSQVRFDRLGQDTFNCVISDCRFLHHKPACLGASMNKNNSIGSLVLFGLFLLLSLPARAAIVVFSENFGVRDGGVEQTACDPDFPSGWTRYNVDGRTPNSAVSYVDDAWVVREDFQQNVTECVAFSTSWYSPVGAADDWLVTPLINIPSLNPELHFRARAYDPLFPDGYEVRWATTNSVAAFLANAPLLSVPAEADSWTARQISLASQAGQAIYLAFRNNSNDKFLLVIDDVQVISLPTHDGAIESVLRPHAELLRLPVPQGIPLQLGATIRNLGTNAITNAVVTAHIKVDGNEVHTLSSAPVASLAPNASTNVALTPYVVTQLGLVTVEYSLTIAEADEDPTNDAKTSPGLLVTPSELGGDDGTPIGTLGIGTDSGGQLGIAYPIHQAAYVRAIRFYTTGASTDLAGDEIRGEIRSMGTSPVKPDALIAETLPYLVPTPPVAGFIDLPFDPPLLLTPGDYYFGLIEPPHDPDQEDTLDLGTALTISIPGRNWVRFEPGAPDWALTESFGPVFLRSLMLRVLFVGAADLSLSKSAPSSVNAGQAFTYTIQVENAGPDPAENLVVSDPLPPGVSFVNANGTGWDCSFSAGTLTCTRPVLLVGSAPPISVDVIAPNAITTLSNTATLTGSSLDSGSPATDTATTEVVSPGNISATKRVSGTPRPGSTLTYSIELTNSSTTAQLDNPGDEFTDVLPPSLTLVGASATTGTAVATLATNTVTWNGSIPALGSVSISIQAAIPAGTPPGRTISNQASFAFDADGNGSNESNGQTDDPSAAGAADATGIIVQPSLPGVLNNPPSPVPSSSWLGLTLLAGLLAGLALLRLGQRRGEG